MRRTSTPLCHRVLTNHPAKEPGSFTSVPKSPQFHLPPKLISPLPLQLHHEQLPSAQARYATEIHRILSVIDKHLTRTSHSWLVGDKLTFVDLMFVPWNTLLMMFMMAPDFGSEWAEKYPKCWDWHQRLLCLDSVKKAQEFAQKSVEVDPGATIQVDKVENIERR